MTEYSELLDDETFKAGAAQGRLRTALTVLTDMLIELNALEVYYQKPTLKSVVPTEIGELRKKMDMVKRLIHESIAVEN